MLSRCRGNYKAVTLMPLMIIRTFATPLINFCMIQIKMRSPRENLGPTSFQPFAQQMSTDCLYFSGNRIFVISKILEKF